ncbi:MAG: hypothetical protein Q9218_001422 [Villophora microphyllina]
MTQPLNLQLPSQASPPTTANLKFRSAWPLAPAVSRVVAQDVGQYMGQAMGQDGCHTDLGKSSDGVGDEDSTTGFADKGNKETAAQERRKINPKEDKPDPSGSELTEA